jgi:hypothetical protein
MACLFGQFGPDEVMYPPKVGSAKIFSVHGVLRISGPRSGLLLRLRARSFTPARARAPVRLSQVACLFAGM